MFIRRSSVVMTSTEYFALLPSGCVLFIFLSKKYRKWLTKEKKLQRRRVVAVLQYPQGTLTCSFRVVRYVYYPPCHIIRFVVVLVLTALLGERGGEKEERKLRN